MLTAAWFAGYGVVALTWTLTGSGFPLGSNDPTAVNSLGDSVSLVSALPAELGAPLFAVIAFVASALAALIAARLARPERGRPWRIPVLAVAVLFTVLLTLVVPDVRLMGTVGYLPKILVGAAFDEATRALLPVAFSAQVLHHLVAVVGGLLWALTGIGFWLATGTARGIARARVFASQSAGRRLARWAVGVAVVIPVGYAVQRIAWVLGIPLGIDPALLASGQISDSSALWLAFSALAGAVLTLGLVQRWGEVFPRWTPGLTGKRVPILLAVIPASVAVLVVLSASIGTYLLSFSASGIANTVPLGWMIVAPMLVWPLWGIALALATALYYVRRSAN